MAFCKANCTPKKGPRAKEANAKKLQSCLARNCRSNAALFLRGTDTEDTSFFPISLSDRMLWRKDQNIRFLPRKTPTGERWRCITSANLLGPRLFWLSLFLAFMQTFPHPPPIADDAILLLGKSPLRLSFKKLGLGNLCMLPGDGNRCARTKHQPPMIPKRKEPGKKSTRNIRNSQPTRNSDHNIETPGARPSRTKTDEPWPLHETQKDHKSGDIWKGGTRGYPPASPPKIFCSDPQSRQGGSSQKLLPGPLKNF